MKSAYKGGKLNKVLQHLTDTDFTDTLSNIDKFVF